MGSGQVLLVLARLLQFRPRKGQLIKGVTYQDIQQFIVMRVSPQESSTTQRRPYALLTKNEAAKLIGLIVAIITVALIFVTPATVYYVREEIRLHTPSPTQPPPPPPSPCQSLPTVINVSEPAECVPEPYTGSVCMQALQTTQTCTPGLGSVMISNSSQTETNLTKFLNLIEQHNGSQQCRDILLPFMCQYTFPLCDNNTKQLYLPMQEKCLEISEQLCSQEWNLTRQLGFQHLLPNCTKLPLQIQEPTTAQIPTSPPAPFSCRNDFLNFQNLNICLPRCDRWKQQSNSSTIVTRSVKFIFSICTILGGVAFLVASAIQYKKMFKFPLILLLYMTVEVFILGIFVLVTEIGSSDLLCGDISLFHSIRVTTPLCLISGAVFHYTIVSMTLFWFFHVCVFFYNVMFPFYANAKRSREKYMHIVMAVIGFGFPIPGVIIGLTVEDSKYSINQFPPSICTSRSPRLLFYSSDLPVNILVGTGTCLLLTLSWEVYKQQGFFKKRHEGHKLMTTAEKKLIVILFHYIMFSFFSFVYFIYILARGDEISAAYSNYFACELLGHVPGRCDRGSFESYDTQIWLFNVSLFLLGFVPTVNLLYVISFRKVAKKIGVLKRQPSHSGQMISKQSQTSIKMSADFRLHLNCACNVPVESDNSNSSSNV